MIRFVRGDAEDASYFELDQPMLLVFGLAIAGLAQRFGPTVAASNPDMASTQILSLDDFDRLVQALASLEMLQDDAILEYRRRVLRWLTTTKREDGEMRDCRDGREILERPLPSRMFTAAAESLQKRRMKEREVMGNVPTQVDDDDDDGGAEIRELMTQTSEAIVECMRMAIAEDLFAQSVVVVRLAPAESLAAVMLCDRDGTLRAPPREMLPRQIAMLAAEPVAGVMLVLLFGKTRAGVGRVTIEQAERFTARKKRPN
jgi:hypothetical protein